MARCGLTRADLRARVAAVLPALLLGSFGPTAFGQAEPPKPANAPVVDKERLFPGNRGAQRMTNVAGEERSLAWMITDRMPDWAEWWATREIMVSLGIPEERAAAIEALLEVRKRARIAAIKASETSEAGVKFVEAARAAGAEVPDAKPPVEIRAELARLASLASSSAFEVLLSADGDFADGCARLVMPAAQPEPDAELRERMRLGVARLRGFDPALSRMKLLNTGVELTIHAAPVLEQAGESRQAIATEIAAWQQSVAPLLEAFERQRSEFAAANAADQPLEQRLRRRSKLSDRARTIHADLVAATVRSARGIAAIIGASDPDVANGWLRSVYHALSPANLGPTGGDAALEEAVRLAASSGDEGKEWSEALQAIRSENLRNCAELEGVLIDTCIQAIRDRDKMREISVQSGAAVVVNERRLAQSNGVLGRVVGAVPSQHRAVLERAFQSRQNQTFHHLPRP